MPRITAQQVDSMQLLADSAQILQVLDVPMAPPKVSNLDNDTLALLHRYENPKRLFLGNTRAPGYNYLWNYDRPVGFYSGFMPALLPEQQPRKYYNTTVPYTSASFFIGSKEETQFEVLHTQNITPNWNVAVDYQRLNVVGFYQRQRVIDSRFRANTHLETPRYTLFGDYTIGRYTTEENGGKEVDSFFSQNLVLNRAVIPINLQAASSTRKNIGLHATHYFYPIFRNANADSTLDFQRGNIRLKLKQEWNDSRYRYKDDLSNPDFYDTTFIFITATDDRAQWYRFQNTLSVEKTAPDTVLVPHLIGSLGFRQAYHMFRQLGERTFRRQYSFVGAARYRKADAFEYKANVDFLLIGEQQGTYRFELGGEQSLKGIVETAGLSFVRQARQPDYIFAFTNSNHFNWRNELELVTSNRIALNAGIAETDVEVAYTIMDGFTYFNASAQPQQIDSTVSILKASARREWNFKTGNWKWVADLSAHIQSFSGTDAIRLPTFFSANRVAAEFPMFKQKMTGRLGMELTYFSAYKGNAYMPATSVFYLQDSLNTGNYPFIDLYFSFRIRNVRAFAKMMHINSGFMGYDYWAAPHYAFRDRAFRVGLEWKFYN